MKTILYKKIRSIGLDVAGLQSKSRKPILNSAVKFLNMSFAKSILFARMFSITIKPFVFLFTTISFYLVPN